MSLQVQLGRSPKLAILIGCVCVAIPAPACAVDPGTPSRAESASTIWPGFYIGGHVGYASGSSSYVAQLAGGLYGQNDQLNSPYGGFQAGYNTTAVWGLMLGLEADLSFPDKKTSSLSPISLSSSVIGDEVELFGSLRGRLGYSFGRWLLYGTGGFAYDRDSATRTDSSGNVDSANFWRTGWVVGAGMEARLMPQWSAKLEYSYFDFGYGRSFFPASGTHYNSTLAFQTVQVGLNYQFADGWAAMPENSSLSAPENWSIHAQSTIVEMGSTPFHSTYSGQNSLFSGGQALQTVSASGFLGYKFAPGIEIYFDPEWFQGFGLSNTHGIAGFPNGEAQKGGFEYPDYNTSRLFLRQTFGLGGDQEELPDGPNQVGEKVDVSRVTVTIGKLSVPDLFDNNAYAHDPRGGFMNYALFDAGAFDFAGDQLGYTWGGAVELNQKNWALRAGYFLEPTVANGNDFDTKIFAHGQYLLEIEDRYVLFGMPGKLRLTGWESLCFCGSFAATLADPVLVDPTLDSNAPDIAATRQTRSEFGFIANVEQTVSDELGLFARLSWRNGQTEIMQFTDIDESLSAGGVLKGTSWGRSNDTVGLAGVINGLSSSYRAYLAEGGLGLIIGDGQLSYRPEQIIEAYYSIGLTNWAAMTLDYQFVANPGYNSDRGPVSIGAVRLHLQM
jgi:high affinity Mn2+ porin